jgi:hypothetical protein
MTDKKNRGICISLKEPETYFMHVFYYLCKKKGLEPKFDFVNNIADNIRFYRVFAYGPTEKTEEVIKEWESVNHNFLRDKLEDFMDNYFSALREGRI